MSDKVGSLAVQKRWWAVAVAAAAILAIPILGGNHAKASGNIPADKMTVAAATNTIMSPGQRVTLMTAQVHTSNPEDLALQVTAECSILTTITTTGNDSANAQGQVRVWIEIDGHPVPIQSIPTGNTTPPTGTDDGKVVFCNRAFERTTSQFNLDNQATIKDFESTRAANAFNWAAFNVGSSPDPHTITVMGELTATASNNSTAQAVIGNRTLLVEPTSLAQNQTTS